MNPEPRFIDDKIMGIRRRYFYPALVLVVAALSAAAVLAIKSGSEQPSPAEETVTRFEQSSPSSAPLAPGQPAPEFDLPVLAGSGSVQFGQEPALIEFFASWCPHCQKMAPIVDRSLQQVPVDFLLVGAARESDRRVKTFHQSFLPEPMPGAAVNDRDLEVTRNYGVSGYPTLVFVDGQGQISAVLTGEHSEQVVVSELEKIAGG
jgi:thiol-disulfide isomerase/thioredoxin